MKEYSLYFRVDLQHVALYSHLRLAYNSRSQLLFCANYELHLSGFLSQIFGGLASSLLNEDIVILTANLLLYNLSCQFHCPDIVQIFPALALQSN